MRLDDWLDAELYAYFFSQLSEYTDVPAQLIDLTGKVHCNIKWDSYGDILHNQFIANLTSTDATKANLPEEHTFEINNQNVWEAVCPLRFGDFIPAFILLGPTKLKTRDTFEGITNFYRNMVETAKASSRKRKARVDEVLETKKSQVEIYKKMEMLNNILDATSDGYWHADLEKNEIFFSASYCNLLGFKYGELESHKDGFWNLIHQDDKRYIQKWVVSVLSGREDDVPPQRFRMKKKNGDYIWITARGGIAERDEKGKPKILVGTQIDVTKWQEANLKAKESEIRFNSLLENSPDAILLIDQKGNLCECNTKLCEYLQYTKDEILEMTVFDIEVENPSTDDKNEWDRLLSGQIIKEYGTHKRKDGSTYPVAVTVGLLEGHTPNMKVCSIRDISKMMAIRNELESERMLLENLIDSVQDLIFYKDLESRYIGCNSAFAKFLRIKKEDIIFKTDDDFYSESYVKEFQESDTKIIKHGIKFRNEDQQLSADNRIVVYDTVKTPIYDKNNEIKGIIGISREITNIRESEKALKRRDSILNGIASIAESFLISSLEDLTFRTMLEILGKSSNANRTYIFRNSTDENKNELISLIDEWNIGEVESRLFDPQYQNTTLNSIGLGQFEPELRSGNVVDDYISNLSTKGNEFFKIGDVEYIILIPIFVGKEWWGILGLDKSEPELVWTSIEIDAVKTAGTILGATLLRQRSEKTLAQIQEDLLETAHRAGMAEIATNILHNVGNVLNTATTASVTIREIVENSKLDTLSKLADLIRENINDFENFICNDKRGKEFPEFTIILTTILLEEREKIHKTLDKLAKSHDHIRQVISLQQSYAGTSGMNTSEEIPSLVEDVIQLLDDSLSRFNIKFKLTISKDLPEVAVDRHKLMQILINLIKNARDALKDMSGIDREIAVDIGINENKQLMIEVNDNGHGMSEEDLKSIFDYGFTTKERGHGYGLHGSINYAHEMGGELLGYSDGIGQGAKFKLILPKREE
jgi:PAS domain S-box-containing protein